LAIRGLNFRILALRISRKSEGSTILILGVNAGRKVAP